MERPFTPDDLVEIEAEMKRVIGEKSSFQRVAISREDAKQRFEAEGEPYKLELLDAADGEITLYTHGEFNDLCRGPHLPDTGRVKCFKLLSQAGAYWRGDSNNTMLQRIYGTAFFDKKELKKHLHRLEEAKKRDHRRLGRELYFTVSEKGDLYHDENEGRSYFEEIGQGLVLWLRAAHGSARSWRISGGGRTAKVATSPCIRRMWRTRTCGGSQAPRVLQREHVQADRGRRRGVPPQADEDARFM